MRCTTHGIAAGLEAGGLVDGPPPEGVGGAVGCVTGVAAGVVAGRAEGADGLGPDPDPHPARTSASAVTAKQRYRTLRTLAAPDHEITTISQYLA
jgi:hypothetical protein